MAATDEKDMLSGGREEAMPADKKLTGEYNHTLDAKNRVFLPAKMRERIGECAMATKSIDKCIALYPMEDWMKYLDRLNELPQTKIRKIKRRIYSNATEIRQDSQGRIVIPQKLREYAELQKNLVIVGVDDHAEIWDEESWIRESEGEDALDIEDVLIDLGF